MTVRCLICKAEWNPICKRSFHMFPKNESIKQKWLDAINVSKTPNFKTAYICSDHFKAESFVYSGELRKRQRLCKEAVPEQKNINNSLNLKRENETKETAIIGINSSSKANTNETDNYILCTDEVTSTNCLQEEASSQSRVNEDVEMCTNSKERPAKRVRFVNGFMTEYVCRKDFVNEEAWNRFLRYSAYQRSRTAAAYKKNLRKDKKIKNLAGVITSFDEREQSDAAE